MNTKMMQIIQGIYNHKINYVVYNNRGSETFTVKGGPRWWIEFNTINNIYG